METGSGSGLDAESSAGAKGPFQFIDSTARTYKVDVHSFSSSANGAAHLLSNLNNQYGSWNAALEGYNGGPGAIGKGYAYNESDAIAKLGEFGLDKAALGGDSQLASLGSSLEGFKSLLDKLFGYSLGGVVAGKEAGEAIEKGNPAELLGAIGLGPLKDIAAFFVLLTTLEFWVRLLEIIAGAALIYMGLRALTGVSASDVPGARTGRRAAEAAAFKRLPPKTQVTS